jgi:predicted ferric reductase
MSTATLWYLSRASGLVLLVVLSLSVVIGVLVRQRVRMAELPRFAIVEVHRNVSLLAVALLTVHVVSAVVDPYVGIGWLAVVVPFISGYEPFWMGLGALSLDLALAVVVTSLLRHRLGERAWRAVHWLAYAAWPVGVAHGIGAAADLQSGPLLGFVLVCVGATSATVGWRVLCPVQRPRPPGGPKDPADSVRQDRRLQPV